MARKRSAPQPGGERGRGRGRADGPGPAGADSGGSRAPRTTIVRAISRAWCALCTVAVAVAGCGTGADQAQVRSATERFYGAVAARDGAAACAQLTPDLRAQLVKDESEPTCAKAVLKLSLRGRRAADVRVYATSGRVTLAGGDTVFLGDTRLGWRIEAVGCRPRTDGPYECEEQA